MNEGALGSDTESIARQLPGRSPTLMIGTGLRTARRRAR